MRFRVEIRIKIPRHFYLNIHILKWAWVNLYVNLHRPQLSSRTHSLSKPHTHFKPFSFQMISEFCMVSVCITYWLSTACFRAFSALCCSTEVRTRKEMVLAGENSLTLLGQRTLQHRYALHAPLDAWRLQVNFYYMKWTVFSAFSNLLLVPLIAPHYAAFQARLPFFTRKVVPVSKKSYNNMHY